MDDYMSIYWAAASLVIWAGSGVSDTQFANAVNLVCDESKMTIPQEVLFRSILDKLSKKGLNHAAE